MRNKSRDGEGGMMKERPILFSAPMVRAILEGRKTMTRRVIKNQSAGIRWGFSGWENGHGNLTPCPYGQPGDWLYIRESARVINVRGGSREIDIEYQADKLFATVPYPARLTPAPKGKLLANGTYREASRILLEITAVRVEHVQDISEDDAESEGVEGFNERCGDDYKDLWTDYSIKQEDNDGYNYFKDPVSSFRSLWDSINLKRGYGWDANPWVWVIEFRLIDVPKN